MDMKRRLIVLFLCAALALSFTPATAAADAPSDWAVNAVNWLRGTGKLTDADFTGYDRVVTRLDFVRLAVVLDELHALIDTKRGAHLMLSLARLD